MSLAASLSLVQHTFETIIQQSSINQTCTISEMTKFENTKQKQKLSLLEPSLSPSATTKSSTFLTEYSTIQEFSIDMVDATKSSTSQQQGTRQHQTISASPLQQKKVDMTRNDRRQQSRQELETLLGSLRSMTQQELQQQLKK